MAWLRMMAGLVIVLLAACATNQGKKPAPQGRRESFRMYEWHGDGVAGSPSVIIYLDEQKAHFFRGKKEVGWTYVATGKPSHPTPTGHYAIREKNEDKISNLYGTLLDPNGNVINGDFNLMKDTLPEGAQFKPARMPYYMRLRDDGVGMHAGPIPRPGSTASHGCIRMPRDMAVKFFNNVDVGTPVTIMDHAPKGKSRS
jgi:lipoprotein-anchoring transpeptidase ErfK/SrfK